jgi:predicted AAA+ superfamily ATPase
MEKCYIKKVFPGGNTSQGFYSFYDYIIGPEARKVFILKGGPGVGKSTFMKYIGSQMLHRGFDLEYHYCSSDNDSIDGVVVPELQVALIDGTAPHEESSLYQKPS